jgi:UrcA family protein
MKTLVSTAIAAALATAFTVAPAQAQDFRVQVKSADLDITSAAGAATLAGRIEAGVTQACVRTQDIRDLKGVASCKEALLSDAAAQLNAKGATLVAGHLSARG